MIDSIFNVTVFVLISKTSFPHLFCNIFHHFWANFLGWQVIDVATYVEEILHFSFGFHSYLGTSNSLSMGEFDICLECTLFWDHFVAFLGRIMNIML